MDIIQQAAIKKKSFELNYNGGTIWCEHLDGMGTLEDEVIAKFNEDKKLFSRPSVSSFMIIDLDETDITEHIVNTIVDAILESNKVFKKIAFVGVEKHWHKQLGTIKQKGIAVRFIDDYEKAKEWVISEKYS